MDVNRLLSLYVGHLGTIIPVLIVLVLGLIFAALLFTVWRRDDGPKTSEDLSAIEETLKKVLEATRHQPAQSAVGRDSEGDSSTGGASKASDGAGATAAGAPSVDTSELTSQIAERERLINELKGKISELETQKASPAAGATPQDTVNLELKIRDLESRLKEYEIIEDDIANLSLYKEENARLKDELGKMKAVAAAELEELVTPAADKLAEEMGLMPATAPEESLEEALRKVEGENPALSLDAEVAAPLAPSEPEPAAEPEVDLVGQLAGLMGDKGAADLAGDAGVPVDAAPPVEDMPEVLKGFDADKIAEEAGNLAEAPAASADAGDDVDPGLKLIEEFEKFSSDEGKKS